MASWGGEIRRHHGVGGAGGASPAPATWASAMCAGSVVLGLLPLPRPGAAAAAAAGGPASGLPRSGPWWEWWFFQGSGTFPFCCGECPHGTVGGAGPPGFAFQRNAFVLTSWLPACGVGAEIEGGQLPRRRSWR